MSNYRNIFFLFCLLLAPCSRASVFPPELSDISVADLQEAALAFLHLSTGPGLEGASQQLAQNERNSTLERSSLGFAADFGLKNLPFDGYWGGAIIQGALTEELRFNQNTNFPTAYLDVRRDITALRGSVGLSYPVTANVRFRPFFNLVLSRFTTKGAFNREGGITPFAVEGSEGPNFSGNEIDYLTTSDADAVTGIGTLESTYQQWFGGYKVDALGEYSLAYTDMDSSKEHLQTTDWNHFIVAKVKVTHSTGVQFLSRDLDWLAYSNYSHYFDQPEIAVGFTQLLELGVGVEWRWQVKPFNWFGLTAFGIKAGRVLGDDVRGYQLSFIIR